MNKEEIKRPGQILDYVDTKEHLVELFNYITNLQEENKKLKEYREGYRKEIDYWRIQFSNNKDIIDKAIEVLKLCNSKCAKETINILRGKDNE